MTKITKTILEQALTDDRLWGNGYRGERDNALDTSDPEIRVPKSQIAKADRLVIECANEWGWTYDQLVAFINSKWGRWFAEDTIYGRVSVGSVARAWSIAEQFTTDYSVNRDEYGYLDR